MVQMSTTEYEPGDSAPASGHFAELNVFGTPTGTVVTMQHGESLPALPRGFSWKPLTAYSAAELRDRAAHYRQMAVTASTAEVSDGLLKLALRFDALASQRDSA